MKKPAWALAVWSDGDWLYVDVPSAIKDGHSHSVRFQNHPNGLLQLLRLIRVRHSASFLGTKGSPTQHQIDYSKVKIRKVGRTKVTYTDAQAGKAKEILRQMGLI